MRPSSRREATHKQASSRGRARLGTCIAAAITIAAALIACGGEDDPEDTGDSPGRLGESCPAEGNEVCSGDIVLQCNQVAGTLEWTVKKDCRDTGRVCRVVSNIDADCEGGTA